MWVIGKAALSNNRTMTSVVCATVGSRLVHAQQAAYDTFINMGLSVSVCLRLLFVLQGSAADIVKGVMVCLQEQLVSTGLAQHCHMLLQVGMHTSSWL